MTSKCKMHFQSLLDDLVSLLYGSTDLFTSHLTQQKKKILLYCCPLCVIVESDLGHSICKQRTLKDKYSIITFYDKSLCIYASRGMFRYDTLLYFRMFLSIIQWWYLKCSCNLFKWINNISNHLELFHMKIKDKDLRSVETFNFRCFELLLRDTHKNSVCK